jgi:hypothetical protein
MLSESIESKISRATRQIKTGKFLALIMVARQSIEKHYPQCIHKCDKNWNRGNKHKVLTNNQWNKHILS